MIDHTLHWPLVARLPHSAGGRLDAVVGRPFHGAVRKRETVAFGLCHPLFHVVALRLLG